MDPAYSSDTVRLFPIYRLKKVRVCWEVKRPQEAGLQLPPEIRTARDSRPVGRGASAPPSPAGGGSPGHWHVGPHGAWPLQKLRGAWLSSLRPRPLSGRGDGLGEGLVSLPGLVLLFSAASPNPSSSSRERSGGTPARSGPPPKGHPNHVALDGKTGSWEKPSGGPWGVQHLLGHLHRPPPCLRPSFLLSSLLQAHHEVRTLSPPTCVGSVFDPIFFCKRRGLSGLLPASRSPGLTPLYVYAEPCPALGSPLSSPVILASCFVDPDPALPTSSTQAGLSLHPSSGLPGCTPLPRLDHSCLSFPICTMGLI